MAGVRAQGRKEGHFMSPTKSFNRRLSEGEWNRVWLYYPMDCSLPGSSIHGILQARILEWVAISFSRRSPWPRDRTQVSHISGRRFNLWATREAPGCLCKVHRDFRRKRQGQTVKNSNASRHVCHLLQQVAPVWCCDWGLCEALCRTRQGSVLKESEDKG